MEREGSLDQEPKHTGAPGARGGDKVPEGGLGQLHNKGPWELLWAGSEPARPVGPLSRALFARYRFSCLFTGSY